MPFALTADYLEYVHDVLVVRHMQFDEPLDPHAYRDRGGLDSAVNRPFQTFGGADLHPTLFDKAAVLFHSLACGHCFFNGNKRTAVMGLDMFLTANDVALLINNQEIYRMAKDTVEANSRGLPLDQVLRGMANRIEEESIPFSALRHPDIVTRIPNLGELLDRLERDRNFIRTHPLNNPRGTDHPN